MISEGAVRGYIVETIWRGFENGQAVTYHKLYYVESFGPAIDLAHEIRSEHEFNSESVVRIRPASDDEERIEEQLNEFEWHGIDHVIAELPSR